MTYRVRHINQTRLVLSFLAIMIISFCGPVILLSYNLLTPENPVAILSIIGGILSSIVYLQYRNHGTRVLSFTGDGFVIDNKRIAWTDIVWYQVKEDNTEFKTLKINTKTKGKFSIAHRTKFKDKDDFEKFLRKFERGIQKLEESGIGIRKESQIRKSKAERMQAFLLLLILIILLIGVFTVKD